MFTEEEAAAGSPAPVAAPAAEAALSPPPATGGEPSSSGYSEWNDGQAFGILGDAFFGKQKLDHGGLKFDHCQDETDPEKNWRSVQS